jgi:hypothetical protein
MIAVMRDIAGALAGQGPKDKVLVGMESALCARHAARPYLIARALS